VKNLALDRDGGDDSRHFRDVKWPFQPLESSHAKMWT